MFLHVLIQVFSGYENKCIVSDVIFLLRYTFAKLFAFLPRFLKLTFIYLVAPASLI